MGTALKSEEPLRLNAVMRPEFWREPPTTPRRARLLYTALSLTLLHTLLIVAPSFAQSAGKIRDVELPPIVAGPYRFQAGDVVEINFFKQEELNQLRTVGPDGEISLILLGPVRIAGRTIVDVTEELTARYAEELVDPQVTVIVEEFSGMKIYVGGEVVNPGDIPYRGELTLVQAIMQAGGFLKTARLSEVVLIRRGQEGEPIGTVVNVQEILKEAQFQNDVPLAPSDLIFVSRSRIANVNLFIEQYFVNNYPIPIFLGFNVAR